MLTFPTFLHFLSVFLTQLTTAGAEAQCQPSTTPFLFPPTTAPDLSAHLEFSNLSKPRGLAFIALGN